VGSFKIVHGFFILGQRDPRGKPEAGRRQALMKKHRREKKLFKIAQRFSAKGRRIVKLNKMSKLLNPPELMEEPLPHDSE